MDEVIQLANDPQLQWMLPLFIVALLAEAIFNHQQQRDWYHARDTATSLTLLILSSVVDLLPKLATIWLMLQLEAWSPLSTVVGRQWWAWVLVFLLDDLLYYGFHRGNHEWRLFWAGHVNHHSSQYLNLGTALRQGVGERIPKYLFWLPLPLLGFDVVMVLTAISVNLFYQFWVHTPAIDKLPGPFEWLFNTPSHHRVHHASNPIYLDRNHGGILIIWDRLFGTFQAELATQRPVYGLTNNLPTLHPWTALTHEYRALWRDVRRSPDWRVRWNYLFGPPGWSHDGEDKSANALRAALAPCEVNP